MKVFFLAIVAYMTISFGGCINSNESTIIGNDIITIDTINIPTFTEIVTKGDFELIMMQNPKTQLIVEGDENIIQLINFDVKGNTLHIGMQSDNIKISTDEHIKIYVHTPQLSSIESKGVLNISCLDSLLMLPTLTIENKGVLTGRLHVQSNKVKIHNQGAGDFSLSGTTSQLHITSKGAGSIVAEDLLAENVAINLSGAGNVTVNATQSLDIDISGVGNVSYKGNPSKLKKNIKGLGSIENIK